MLRILLPIFLIVLVIFSCQDPKTEEARLLESLERLPSVDISDRTTFSLANDQILVTEVAVSLKSIQLLNGFSSALVSEGQVHCLEAPIAERKYPFALKQEFEVEGLEMKRLLVLSQDKPGLTMLNFIKNVGKSHRSLRFQFAAASELKPSVMMDSTFGENGVDQVIFDELTGIFTAKDELNDWYAVWASSGNYALDPVSLECGNLASSAGFEVKLELAPDEVQLVPVYIAGSDQSEIAAMETLADLRTDLLSDWDKSFELSDSLISTSNIKVKDAKLQEAFEWSKLKTGLFQVGKDSVFGIEIEKEWKYQSLLREINKDYVSLLDRNLFLQQNDSVQVDYQVPQHQLLELLGISADLENRVTYIRPNLPSDWNEASIENLWIDDNKLNIAITSEENQMTVEITQSQKKAGLSIELPEEFSQVKVLGKEVSTDTKDGFRRILMTGDHVRIEAKK